ncbi:MAG: hypothetical protein WBC06_14570 [Chitinophagaceae bacterium]
MDNIIICLLYSDLLFKSLNNSRRHASASGRHDQQIIWYSGESGSRIILLIFTMMTGKMIKNIILLIFLFAVTCLRSNRINAAPVILKAQSKILANCKQHSSNGELERVHLFSAQGRNITGQRNISPLTLPQGIFIYEKQISFTSSVVKSYLLRVKDYLLHIHPSHHFW